MKNILSTLALTLVISPAFAGQGGFGVGGPDSYIWAEINTNPTRIAESRSASPDTRMPRSLMEGAKTLADTDQGNDGRVSNGGRMSPDLAPGSTYYGGFL
jgi:hypothetical protein